MYEVQIIKTEGSEISWIRNHKIGDILEVPDDRYYWIRDYVKVIKHFRWKKREKCPHCGNYVGAKGIKLYDT